VSYRVTFTAFAASDLDAIDDYIARDSPDRAIAWVRSIRKRCEELAEMPERGPQREDIGPGIRALVFERRAVIAYRIEAQTVRIVRIFYKGQDYTGLGEEPNDWDDDPT
jgi:toxin ParE1/3/4